MRSRNRGLKSRGRAIAQDLVECLTADAGFLSNLYHARRTCYIAKRRREHAVIAAVQHAGEVRSDLFGRFEVCGSVEVFDTKFFVVDAQ